MQLWTFLASFPLWNCDARSGKALRTWNYKHFKNGSGKENSTCGTFAIFLSPQRGGRGVGGWSSWPNPNTSRYPFLGDRQFGRQLDLLMNLLHPNPKIAIPFSMKLLQKNQITLDFPHSLRCLTDMWLTGFFLLLSKHLRWKLRILSDFPGSSFIVSFYTKLIFTRG